MDTTTIVETHSLTKRYGSGVLAVNSVDMSVRRGQVYGFLGLNGSGKTTTLRMLVGLIRATSGTVTIAGHAPGEPAGQARTGQSDRTVLVSSHLLGEVEQVCDRVGVISDGRLVREATVQELLGEEGVLVRAQPIEGAVDLLSRMFGPTRGVGSGDSGGRGR